MGTWCCEEPAGDRTRLWKTPRLYVEAPLARDKAVSLQTPQAHYLRTVLRLGEGAPVRLFNGQDGEWLARLGGGRTGVAIPEDCLRPQTATRGPWLLFSPLKKEATDYVIQKSVELGCTRLQPVFTRHTQGRQARIDRYRQQAVEAAEQCERLDVPEITPALPLEEVTGLWPEDRTLFVALERDETTRDALPAFQACTSQKAAFLIGPEGGLSAGDLDALRSVSPVCISLGPRILRAETACAAVLTLWQACAGDWLRAP